MIIRKAHVSDAAAIAEAEREIAKTPGYFCSEPHELTEQKVEETLSHFLATERGIYLVAEHEGQIIGHAFLEPLSPASLSHVVELNIAVHLGWQEKGVGARLLGELILWAKKTPWVEKIELKVRASNVRAIALYKKMGFLEEGRLKNHVKVPQGYLDDLLMALPVKKAENSADSLVEFFEASPLMEMDLDLKRSKDSMREFDL